MTEYTPNPNEPSLSTAAGFVNYIVPAKGIKLPDIPPLCIVAYSNPLLERARESFFHRMVDIGSRKPTPVYFFRPEQGNEFAMVSPQYGSAMAACLLEELIALGMKNFVSLGTAGHPSDKETPDLSVGDILLIRDALRYEGTSVYYLPKGVIPTTNPGLTAKLKAILDERGIKVVQGRVATTDAIYRETPSFLEHAIANGANGLDMETAALLAVASHHKIPLATLLYVSDLLAIKKNSNGAWHLEFLGGNVEKAEESAFQAAVELANRVD